MDYLGYLVPIGLFIILLAETWDDLWIIKFEKLAMRGKILLITGFCMLLLGLWQYGSDIRETKNLVNSIKREGTRLLPADFQIMLRASVHAGDLTIDYNAPEQMELYASIGEIDLNGRLALLAPNKKEYSGRNPFRTYNYCGRDLFVRGLEKIQYLDNLKGETLFIHIPWRALSGPFAKSKTATIEPVINIKGRSITLPPSSFC